MKNNIKWSERQLTKILKKKIFKMVAKNAPFYKLRIKLLRMCGYSIGKNVYIAEGLIISEKLDYCEDNLIIGNRVAIGPRVTLVTVPDPNFSKRLRIKTECGKIIIKDDAWIGAGAVILPNITIGEGAVVGANAVVTKDVEPYTIVAGVPARVIRKLKVENENSN